MTRIAILISGSGSNMAALLDDMAGPDHPARPVLVLSNRPEAAGVTKAQARGIPTEVVDHRKFPKDRKGFDAALQAVLTRYAVEFVCLAGFMRIFTPDFVTAWSGRMLNIHPSLLPRHKGLETHAKALAAGDRDHGCTVHAVTPDLDSGPILGQARLTVHADDTAQSLAARVLELEHRLYPAVLRRVLAGDHSLLELS